MLAETETRPINATEPLSVIAAAERVLTPMAPTTTFDQLEADLRAAEVGWLREADRTDEVKAANEGREVTAEDEAVWSAASDAHWAAVDALTAYRPRSAAEFLRKARLMTNQGDTRLRAEEQFADLYIQDAEAVAQLGLDAPLSRPDLRPAWDAARARYDETRAAYDKVSREWDALDDELIARAPEWNRKPRDGDGKPLLRWCSLKNFEASHDGLFHMRPKVEEWAASEAAELERLHQLGTDISDFYDRFCDAERAMIETPAPDLAAVIFKQRRFGCETDDDKRGYSDPAYAAARRDASYVAESWPLWIHEDVLRLAGVPDPLLTTDHFKPRDWKNRFEAAGGKAYVTPQKFDLKIDLPRDPGPASALLAELAAPGATETLTRYLVELRR